MVNAIMSALAFMLAFTLLTPTTSAQILERDVPSAAQLGAGYKSGSDEIAGQCLKGEVKRSEAGGQAQQFFVRKLETQADLSRFLEISLETRADAFGGLFSGSSKVAYLQSVATNSYSLFYAVKLIIQSGELLFDNPSLTQDASRLVEDNDFESFRRLCGDYFLKSFKTGGEYHAVLEIRSNSQHVKEEVAAALLGKGAFELLSTEGQTRFRNTLDRYEKEIELTFWSYSAGAAIEIVSSIAAIEALLTRFSLALRETENRYPYKVVLLPYETVVPRFTAEEYRADARHRRAVLQMVVDEYDRVSQSANNYNYYLRHVADFTTDEFVDDIKLAAQDAANSLDELARTGRNCYEDRTQCDMAAVQEAKHFEVRLPPTKGEIILGFSCAVELANVFVSDRQGCRHLPTRTSWQFSRDVRLMHSTAKMFCQALRSPDGTSGWTLPTVVDLRHLVGSNEGSGPVHLGIDQTEQVWSGDGVAFTLGTGFSQRFPEEAKLPVLCVLDGNR